MGGHKFTEHWRYTPERGFERYAVCNWNSPNFHHVDDLATRSCNDGGSANAYVDDIIVFGATEAEFLANVEKIFSRLEQYNVYVKPSKVRLGLTKAEYVGREIHHDDTTMQDEKTQKVLDFPLPEYVKFLRSFIGLAEYFRNHIYGNFSAVMQPLRKLASISEKNKNKLKWNEVPQAK